MVEWGSGLRTSSQGGQLRDGWDWRKLWLDSESCGFLGGSLGSLDTCHHPNEGQILTSTGGNLQFSMPYLTFSCDRVLAYRLKTRSQNNMLGTQDKMFQIANVEVCKLFACLMSKQSRSQSQCSNIYLFDVARALIFYVGMLKCRCYLSSLSSKPVYF